MELNSKAMLLSANHLKWKCLQWSEHNLQHFSSAFNRKNLCECLGEAFEDAAAFLTCFTQKSNLHRFLESILLAPSHVICTSNGFKSFSCFFSIWKLSGLGNDFWVIKMLKETQTLFDSWTLLRIWQPWLHIPFRFYLWRKKNFNTAHKSPMTSTSCKMQFIIWHLKALPLPPAHMNLSAYPMRERRTDEADFRRRVCGARFPFRICI